MAFRELEKVVISDRWIEDYRRKHISRAFEVRLKGGLIKPRHPHRNHPYCNICDKDYEVWDVGYKLYVGGHPVIYHSNCIQANWETKKVRNIVGQNKGFRRKMEREQAREKKEATQVKLRAQLYKFIIGSVLSDASVDNPWPKSDRRPNVQPLTPFSELEIPGPAASDEGLAEASR
jgi:hypothetical protein